MPIYSAAMSVLFEDRSASRSTTGSVGQGFPAILTRSERAHPKRKNEPVNGIGDKNQVVFPAPHVISGASKIGKIAAWCSVVQAEEESSSSSGSASGRGVTERAPLAGKSRSPATADPGVRVDQLFPGRSR